MSRLSHGLILAGLLTLSLGAKAVAADSARTITIYKSPTCGCCEGWTEHMRQAGFEVFEKNMDDLSPVKTLFGVPDDLQSCHTATVDGYVIEGHVPSADIIRLLAERPGIKGLSTPGMPADAPGMDGGTGTPYDVLTFNADGETRIYTHH